MLSKKQSESKTSKQFTTTIDYNGETPELSQLMICELIDISLDMLREKFEVPYVNYQELGDEIMKNIVFKPLVEVRPSPIAGNGVFALEDIPAGSIATIYPMDLVYTKLKTKKKKAKTDCWGIKFDEYAQYGLESGVSDLVYCGNPANKHPMFLGHLLNDSSNCGRGPKEIIKYLLGRKFKQNCVFGNVGELRTINTTKDIKKGEELLVAYGVKYWNGHVDEDLKSATYKEITMIDKLNNELIKMYPEYNW